VIGLALINGWRGDQVLLKNEYARSASQIGLQSTKVLEKVDDSTIVFTGTWQPGGWAAALLAPREVVIKRTWRWGAHARLA
jgi:hypothetical protein